MLVIDGVELVGFDQAEKMGKFESGDPTRLKKDSKAFDEVVYVRDVGQNIIRAHKVSRIATRAKRLGLWGAEKSDFSGHATTLRYRRDIGRWFDPEHRDARLDKVASRYPSLLPISTTLLLWLMSKRLDASDRSNALRALARYRRKRKNRDSVRKCVPAVQRGLAGQESTDRRQRRAADKTTPSRQERRDQ